MPLVQNSSLPTFSRLRNSGVEVLQSDRAAKQDIRELHIGLLNLMPDAALEATERQFFRLLGSCNRIAQFHIHPFTVTGVDRAEKAQAHIDAYYQHFRDVVEEGLDALVISGANPANPDITQEGFWDQMLEVIDWASENVCSTFYSCLATHAVIQHYHDLPREKLSEKRWGVYSHRVIAPHHPLVSNINTRFDAPHSHVYDTSPERARAAGWQVLVEGEESGLYLAVSADGFRHVYCQGHPEYDINSLLKEYKREVNRYIGGVREKPPYPKNYFPAPALEYLEEYLAKVDLALDRGDGEAPSFPEESLLPMLENTWSDTGRAIFNNWLGQVYQITHRDRKIPFMDDVDPANPLGLPADASN
ncbi:MAG: homoserine O-succinyltransferase [Pseudomonadota bacterium]